MDNRFLTNYTEMTFLDELKANLSCCKAFYFSVSFIYVGKGHLTNMRNSGINGTYLFDVQMENTLPEYLQYDFGLNYGS